MDLINWTKHPDPNEIDQKELDILLNLIQKKRRVDIRPTFSFRRVRLRVRSRIDKLRRYSRPH